MTKDILDLLGRIFSGVIASLALIAIGGTCIGSVATIPNYAPVVVDDESKTVLAYQCIADWVNRIPVPVGKLRPSTIGSAFLPGYSYDEDCNNTGVFFPDGPNLTEEVLIHFKLMSKPTYWWNDPNLYDLVEPASQPVMNALPWLYLRD
jgi:hypothetical protein